MSIQVDGQSLIINDCVSIAAAMRRGSRWSEQRNIGVAAILGGQFGSDGLFADSDSILGSRASKQGKIHSHNSSSASKFKSDDPLLSGLIQLRSMLINTNSISEVDSLTLLQPFLMVVKSPETSGYVTSLALTTLHKVLRYSLLTESSLNAVSALHQTVDALTHCRFQSDNTSDDAVLLRVLGLLQAIVESSVGYLLSDDVLYDIIQTCLSLACNKKRSEVLRKGAEMTISAITVKLFTKLIFINPASHDGNHLDTRDHQLGDVSHSIQPDMIGGTIEPGNPVDTEPSEQHENSKSEIDEQNGAKNLEQQDISNETKGKEQGPQISLNSSVTDDSVPYGIVCIREHFKILIAIINPKKQFETTESTKVLAFQLITTAIEVSGNEFPKHPSLMNLVSDEICHHLLHTIQNVESPAIVTHALSLFCTLTVTLGSRLKIQIELILRAICNSIVEISSLESVMAETQKRVLDTPDLEKKTSSKLDETTAASEIDPVASSRHDTPVPGRSPVFKEFLIESLSVFWTRSPLFFTTLYQLYDCDFDRTDLSVDIINFLCRVSLPDSATFTTDNVPPLCLEGLLSLINGFHARVKNMAAKKISLNMLPDNSILERKSRKTDFIYCTKTFDKSFKEGLKTLQEKGFVDNSDDLDELANFFFVKSSRLNKRTLGEFLAKPKNLDLLKKFVGLFDFKGLRVDEALRVLLKSFRIPGESQQIERIVETFAERYVECQNYPKDIDSQLADGENNEHVMPDKDSVFVLSYSIIMLNTDLHNPQVKNQMTLPQYGNILKGTYNGKDFPAWYIEKIYYAIKEREFVMPEEHDGSNNKWFDQMWANLMAEQANYDHSNVQDPKLFTNDSETKAEDIILYDRALFSTCCTNILTSLVTIFNEATDDQIITRMIAGIDKLASVASYFGLNDYVDKILSVLAYMSTLTGSRKTSLNQHEKKSSSSDSFIPTTQILYTESGKTLTVSEMSVWFGRDLKAQLCTVVFFRILQKSGTVASENWKKLMDVLITLFEHGLIDPDLFIEMQQRIGLRGLPHCKPQFQITKSKAKQESGFIASFSSFMKGFSDDAYEPTEEEIESTLSAQDCIKSCNISSLIEGFSKSSSETIAGYVSSMFEHLPQKSPNTFNYVPKLLFIVETAVALTLISEDDKLATATLKNLSDLTLDIEADDPNELLKPWAMTRLNIYKLLLLHGKGHENSFVLLGAIDQLNQLLEKHKEIVLHYGVPILKPLQLLVVHEGYAQKVLLSKEEYWNILRTLASSPKLSKYVCETVEKIVELEPTLITAGNFMNLLGLLDEISAVGAVGSQWEQEYDRLVESGHNIEKNNTFKDIIDVSIKSIDIASSLSPRIVTPALASEFLNQETNAPDAHPIYSLIQALAHQCFNPCRQIRSHAIQVLQSFILNIDLEYHAIDVEGVFQFGLLPLLAELIKSDVVRTDEKGMIKTQIQAISATCKTILKFQNDFTDLNKVLSDILLLETKLISTNQNRQNFQDETIEILRNVLLVMKPSLDLEQLYMLRLDETLKSLIKDVSFVK
ncbi:ARF guanine-nucleotide exchange factor 2 [Komagataella phaffii CBS 7435]|uniref:Guanine nucleotide exchange factor for ADP ribosylation factors (ARFs) n=2 Tax=Komagataella phaffii TaxID=460519 RepID=C4QYF9_KOMPG|nr:Guanine nucleotide exchange factor for ADP ribosylation factors (ARFs) [Komagataella phaffii GS115]AOA61603.1 GQ67_01726T0 [Komagataella phaffii]CAH2447105.1 ARF guanine-nucleotide exchange factor 2 [Komagataella phaffii CBS 7435]AOA66582.1 GQ68_01741T0 [Komagataella phaffii GS115]CAY68282.1 Guanine nucleotide exchange factor for ADP ribosylation factors (ARFs) [Komagataella phaffii GS115]CCA37351.1 ARF guanine-nucleotide exchange factor 2 [Komagataella phaffii CBS 7435]